MIGPDWIIVRLKIRSSLSNICSLSHVTKSTKVSYKSNGTKMVPCIGLIVYNVVDLCSTADSTPAGLSDHNSVSISRKTKGPKLKKATVKTVYWQWICEDFKHVYWSRILFGERSWESLRDSLIMPIMDKRVTEDCGCSLDRLWTLRNRNNHISGTHTEN